MVLLKICVWSTINMLGQLSKLVSAPAAALIFRDIDLLLDWGDVLEITVINNMADNGFVLFSLRWTAADLELSRTSIHWHGINQQDSAVSDG